MDSFEKSDYKCVLYIITHYYSQIGVKDANARQRILGGVLHVHKKEWKMSSHSSLPHNRNLRYIHIHS